MDLSFSLIEFPTDHGGPIIETVIIFGLLRTNRIAVLPFAPRAIAGARHLQFSGEARAVIAGDCLG